MSRNRIATVLALVCVTAGGLLAVNWDSRAGSSAETQSREAAVPEKLKTLKLEKPKPEKSLLAQFMRAKLVASSQVLEGLCTEDFDLIGKGARGLKKVSSAERWRVSNDIMFRQHSAEFRTGVDQLLRAAEKKQIDSAVLAWTKTTFNCIECHRWVRATLVAERTNLDNRALNEGK